MVVESEWWVTKNPFFGIANQTLQPWRDQKARPNKLYHYTSSAGLLGIIEKDCLWFSDSSYMNDGSEQTHGIEVFVRVLADFMDGKPENEREIAVRLVKQIRDQRSGIRTVIFCMSDGANLLNQWRDYGKDITAYSIEFETAALNTASDFSFQTGLMALNYDPAEQRQLARQLVEQIYKIANDISDTDLDEIGETNFLVAAATEVQILAAHFKNPAFEAEKEWRLSVYVRRHQHDADPAPKFRPTHLGVVPYWEWRRKDGNPLPITQVIVGPTPHAAVSHDALRYFLDRNGYTTARTDFSIIPLRR